MIQADDIELKKIDQFSRLSGKRILEVGCGDGRLSPFLARKAGMVIAVDTDAARIKAAKAAVPG